MSNQLYHSTFCPCGQNCVTALRDQAERGPAGRDRLTVTCPACQFVMTFSVEWAPVGATLLNAEEWTEPEPEPAETISAPGWRYVPAYTIAPPRPVYIAVSIAETPDGLRMARSLAFWHTALAPAEVFDRLMASWGAPDGLSRLPLAWAAWIAAAAYTGLGLDDEPAAPIAGARYA